MAMNTFMKRTKRITLTLVLIAMLFTATGAFAEPVAPTIPAAENNGGAPAGLSEAEWAQIKSQLPKPVAASLDTESAILHASDAQADDEFGESVSISGDTLVVGAECEDSGSGDPISAPTAEKNPQKPISMV